MKSQYYGQYIYNIYCINIYTHTNMWHVTGNVILQKFVVPGWRLFIQNTMYTDHRKGVTKWWFQGAPQIVAHLVNINHSLFIQTENIELGKKRNADCDMPLSHKAVTQPKSIQLSPIHSLVNDMLCLTSSLVLHIITCVVSMHQQTS